LSEQAAALYKSWFVDFEPFEGEKPDDWNDGTVGDLANEIVCGKTPSTKKEEYYGKDVPFVTIPDMHGCIYTVHTERKLSVLGADSQSKKTLPKNSICVSCIGTAGLVVLLSEPSQTNQQINTIVPKANYSPYYIYLMMDTMAETINKLGQAGSTIVNLNKTQFGKMEVMIPSVAAMSDFDEIVEPMFKEILSNQIENKELLLLRDELLPKLMVGDIDLSDIELLKR
jgi:putative type-1 restriction enzyme hindVIIP specificity protein